MNDSSLGESAALNLEQLSRKTGLVVRSLDSTVVTILFAKLEEYDSDERAETLEYLIYALDETRTSLEAEPVFKRGNPGSELQESDRIMP